MRLKQPIYPGESERLMAQKIDLFTAPNLLSLTRIPLAIACMAILTTQHEKSALLIVLGFMALAELTDLLDGIVARSTGQVSQVGKILDPMTDSLYRTSIFAAFLVNGWLPLWAFAVFFMRDIIVSYLRILSEQRSITLAARMSGKLKAIIQGVAQIGVVIAMYIGTATSLAAANWLIILAVAITAYSLFDYGKAVLTNQKGAS